MRLVVLPSAVVRSGSPQVPDMREAEVRPARSESRTTGAAERKTMTEHVARPGRTAPVFIPVEAGAKFTAPVGLDGADVEYEVRWDECDCAEDRGQWFCVTCLRAFRNNLEKDTHATGGTHVLAWICFEHGPEVP